MPRQDSCRVETRVSSKAILHTLYNVRPQPLGRVDVYVIFSKGVFGRAAFPLSMVMVAHQRIGPLVRLLDIIPFFLSVFGASGGLRSDSLTR